MKNGKEILIVDRKRRINLLFSISLIASTVSMLWLFYMDRHIGDQLIIAEYGPLFEGFVPYLWFLLSISVIYALWSFNSAMKYTEKMESQLEEYIKSIKLKSLRPD